MMKDVNIQNEWIGTESFENGVVYLNELIFFNRLIVERVAYC